MRTTNIITNPAYMFVPGNIFYSAVHSSTSPAVAQKDFKGGINFPALGATAIIMFVLLCLVFIPFVFSSGE